MKKAAKKLQSSITIHSHRLDRDSNDGHPDWIYEIKFGAFRVPACIEDRKCRLVSRPGKRIQIIRQLQDSIAELPKEFIQDFVPLYNASGLPALLHRRNRHTEE